MKERPERMHIIIAGHVDHGKSTVLGRLLADTGFLPDGKLELVRANCAKNSRPFEYAFLVDALKDEQAQGITIDSARVFFKTGERECLFIDAPGHVEFLKNMLSGATRAGAALLVIDAKEGVRENTRRHGYLMSMIGVRQLAVIINKMDLVGYSEEAFRSVAAEYGRFLEGLGISPAAFIPASGLCGDNVSAPSIKMPWYKGDTVLGVIAAFKNEPVPADRPFRMYVQDVYKFAQGGDDRRIISGTPESGSLRAGDAVVFYPSGKKSRVKSIESFPPSKKDLCRRGEPCGFTLDEQVYITRGELAVREDEEKPEMTACFKAMIFWMGREPLEPGKSYLLKIGTRKTPAKIEAVTRVMDPSSLRIDEARNTVGRHEAAECVISVNKPIVLECAGSLNRGKFVLVDGYDTAAGGIIHGSADNRASIQREQVETREVKWIKSAIAPEKRAERCGQKPFLVVVTGEAGAPRKEIARLVEKELFEKGFAAYLLGFGSVLYGVDADLKRAETERGTALSDDTHEAPHFRWEHMRRFGEVANILLDAGTVLIMTAAELTEEDLSVIRASLDKAKMMTVCIGPELTDLKCDMAVDKGADAEKAAGRIIEELCRRGIVDTKR